MKLFSSRFIGKQLSRLKMGQTYYAIAVSTVSMISLIVIAFNFDIWTLFLMFPIFLFGAFFIGYYMDVKNINTQDWFKTNEMQQRFLLTSDIKSQEFQLLLIKIILKSLQDIQNNRPINMDYAMKEYEKYQKKWQSPDL